MRHSSAFLGVALLAFVFSSNSAIRPTAQTAPTPELVSFEEAEILIYVLPEAHEVRREGMEIGWELQTNDKLKQADFYTFWVYNAKRPCENCSLTIGYFSVNRHTAAVWDDSNAEIITSTEIEGIQKIIRNIRHIDKSTLESYGARRPPDL